MATVAEVQSAYAGLTAEDQTKFQTLAIQDPSSQVADKLWIMTFVVLAIVIIGGALLAIKASGSDETALYGFVGIALGALAGLLAPSPVST
jgi:hypothetical protein